MGASEESMGTGSEPYYFDPELRRKVESILLPDVQLPGQYIGGEIGRIVKKARDVRGRFCFAFPDAYTIGMSNYALQVLYAIVLVCRTLDVEQSLVKVLCKRQEIIHCTEGLRV